MFDCSPHALRASLEAVAPVNAATGRSPKHTTISFAYNVAALKRALARTPGDG